VAFLYPSPSTTTGLRPFYSIISDVTRLFYGFNEGIDCTASCAAGEVCMSVSRFAWSLVSICVIVIIVLPGAIALFVRPRTAPGTTASLWVDLWDCRAGTVRRMPLADYLVGVVAAEMPAAFDLEALKAQAVAARTYTLRKMWQTQETSASTDVHKGAVICSDPSHCQAWSSREELLKKWGVAGYLANIRKVIAAVEETEGLVMTYNGRLIDAVYHSCCGGMTEDAAAVWGRRVPYLVPVSCGCQQKALELGEMKTLEGAELVKALGLGSRSLPAMSSGVQVVARTATARASMVSVYGVPVSAADLRRALSLKSTRLAVVSSGGKVTITTTGYGHGVGMCQWGAENLARAGLTFDAILKHYYSGIEIQRLDSSRK
jgi:stage II sporulation protein D